MFVNYAYTNAGMYGVVYQIKKVLTNFNIEQLIFIKINK